MKRPCHKICPFLLVAFQASAFFSTRGTLPSSAPPPPAVGSPTPPQQVLPRTTETKLRIGWPTPLLGRPKQADTDDDDGQQHRPRMAESARVRPVQKKDLPALKSIIDETDLFPSDLLDGMTDGYFNNDAEEVWLACLRGDSSPAGLVYAKPEMMTEGTWNALLFGGASSPSTIWGRPRAHGALGGRT